MLSEEFHEADRKIRRALKLYYFTLMNKIRISYARKENAMIRKALKENKSLTDEDRQEFEEIIKSNKENINWVKDKANERQHD